MADVDIAHLTKAVNELNRSVIRMARTGEALNNTLVELARIAKEQKE